MITLKALRLAHTKSQHMMRLVLRVVQGALWGVIRVKIQLCFSAVRFCNYALMLSCFTIWSACYGLQVHYYGFEIHHFISTNCNGSFIQFAIIIFCLPVTMIKPLTAFQFCCFASLFFEQQFGVQSELCFVATIRPLFLLFSFLSSTSVMQFSCLIMLLSHAVTLF